MITHRDIFSIFITFVIGMIGGFYFYLTGFTFDITSIHKSDVYSEFSIEGKAYGGCKVRGCMSFQLLSDGSYRLLVTELGVGEVIKDGVIPKNLKTDLAKNLDENNLTKQARNKTSLECASDSGGIDYNFRVVREGRTYELDTCKTSVSYSSDTWNAIAKLWKYFETLE